MPIETTVIGSFPKSKSPLEVAIRDTVELQLQYGINVITDGELRGNMIRYFEQIPGLERYSGGLRVAEKIKPMEQGKIDEFYKISDYKTVKSILKGLDREDVKVKIPFSGPVTLGTFCALGDMESTLQNYNLDNEETLYNDFSRFLLQIVERALCLGAYVQIDEPILSTGKVPIETAKKVLEDFTSHLPVSAIKDEKLNYHVCGSIKAVPNLYELLLDSDIPILSFGFSGDEEKENLEVISKKSFEEHGKKLGAGFISNIKVEDEAVVLQRYRKIEKLVGKENIKYIHPDCGFGATAPEKVRSILQTMKAAADKLI